MTTVSERSRRPIARGTLAASESAAAAGPGSNPEARTEAPDLEAQVSRAERFGHRLAALAPPARPAPIQRVRWKWNASSQSWSEVGSISTATPPSHQGGVDGEEYDDTHVPYSQEKDPTAKPFLRTGQSFMGGPGVKKQLKGQPPSPEDIRESAVKTPQLRSGSGLHEVLPTNMGPEVAKSGNPVMVGLQSGLRTSTAHQLFSIGSDEVGAHTGFAPKPGGGPGSTHTKGQGPSHDKLRKKARSLKDETDPDTAVNEMTLTHLELAPTGQDVMKSPYITGMQPSALSIGTIGPPVSTGTPDPERVKLAQRTHKERERVKKRARSLKRSLKRGRSPSPPREPIDDQGGGGGHVTDAPADYPLSPVPFFEGGPGSFEVTANMGSWMTAPQRENFDFGSPPPVTQPPPSSLAPPPSLAPPLAPQPSIPSISAPPPLNP